MSSVSTLKYFTIQYNQFVPPLIVAFGIIGNCLNLLIFSRRALRSNPCTTYFLALSIAYVNTLISGQFINYLRDVHGILIQTANVPLCRLRSMILHCSLALSSWLIVLAGMDRFLISSREVRRRNLSTLRNARLTVAIATLICLLSYCHSLFLFTVDATPSGRSCYAPAGSYRIFYDFFFFATYSFTPPILMIIVGLATFRHIIHVRQLVAPHADLVTVSARPRVHQMRRKDRQFLTMLLLQLFFSAFLTLPVAMLKIYVTLTQDQTKSAGQLEAESFAAQITQAFSQINGALSFYL